MSLVVKLNGSTLPAARVRLRGNGDQGFGAAQNADGSMAQGGIVFDDPDSSLDVKGWMPVVVTEPDCVKERLFTGWVGDRTYRRGHYKSGDGREIDTTLLDPNVLLTLHRINGSDSLRPAETDTARLAWLLGSGYIPLVEDLGLVNGAGRMFDATQYKGQLPQDVLNDLAGPRGQIFFVYWNNALDGLGLFFDDPEATGWDSPLSISNVLSDVDDIQDPSALCFAPYAGAESFVDPSDVFSDGRYVFNGGAVYDHIDATRTEFFSGDLGHRDTLIENDRVGSPTTAATFLHRILVRDSKEAQSIDLTVRLPSSKVGYIQSGHRLAVRLSYVPGFETFAYTRVESLTIVQTEDRRDYYDMGLHLSTHGLSGGGGTGNPGGDPGNGGGGTQPYPYQPPVPQEWCATTSGSGISASSIAYSGSGPGWVVGQESYRGQFAGSVSIEIESFAIAGYTAISNYCYISIYYSWDGGPLFQVAVDAEFTSAPGTFTNQLCWNAGSISRCQGESDGTPYPTTPSNILDPDPGSPTLHTLRLFGIKAEQADNVGPATFCVTIGDVSDVPAVGSPVVVPNEIAPADPPQPGSPVIDELVGTGDGTTVTFTTAHPYVLNSLKVYVDGVQIIAGLTQTDPAAGSFTLDFAPLGASGDTPAEKVTVTYVAGPA